MRWLGMVMGMVAGAAQAADLEVTVAGVRNGDGRVMVAVFDHAEAFQKMAEEKRIAAAQIPIDGGTARLVIGGLKPGRYAVSVVHDANGNGKLDTNLVGLPTEGYGFSRDARGTMGLPSFEAAAFDLPAAGTKQIIKLGY
jgi:uncharacterized protein (DUF2141 family)